MLMDTLHSMVVPHFKRIWVISEADNVHICVGDEGPGIPVDERSRLFTQFGKLSARPTDGEHSTGLGLWIVKGIVEGHSGRILVRSKVGRGTTFKIIFPVSPD